MNGVKFMIADLWGKGGHSGWSTKMMELSFWLGQLSVEGVSPA